MPSGDGLLECCRKLRGPLTLGACLAHINQQGVAHYALPGVSVRSLAVERNQSLKELK